MLKLLYFCQIKVQIEIIIIILFAKSGCCVDCKGSYREMANFKSLPSNSYYQLKAILNSVIRLKSPTESKKDNLTKPSQCIVHISITVRS